MFGNKRKRTAKKLLTLSQETLKNIKHFHDLTPDQNKKEVLKFFIEKREQNVREFAELVGNPDAYTSGLDAFLDPLAYCDITEKALIVEIKKYKEGDDEFIQHLSAIKESVRKR